MANEDRPIIQRPNVDTGRPMIQRPTVDTGRPMIQPPAAAASPAQRTAPTPTQGRQDTGSHPGRKTDRSAHTSRLANILAIHNNNFMKEEIEDGSYEADTPTDTQDDLDEHRANRHKLGYDKDTQDMSKEIGASFKNRHNKDYAYEDLYE